MIGKTPPKTTGNDVMKYIGMLILYKQIYHVKV